MIKVLICGANGMMGKTVNSCIKEREDCTVLCGVDLNTAQYDEFPIFSSFSEVTEKPDVIIDFSHPSVLKNVLEYAQSTGTPVVFATTGYSDEQIAEIKKAAQVIPAFFTFNLSLGINLLVELAKKATSILGEQFDIEIVEKHHHLKIDAPSGTAIMLANAINETSDNKYNYNYDRHSQRKKRDKNEIGIHAVRGGTIVGEHEVIFAGHDEVITLSHSAASKGVFAAGSVNAAMYIANCKPGLYDMSSLV